MWEALFRNTLTGWQWALLALVPPAILALYFLKLKRQPLVVPSTYLWKKSIEDLHVNSLWQRLRKSILLFLQLLLVLLAMLSLLRPGWQSLDLQGERFIVMIDNSASMNATDVDENRLALAKQRALAVVDQLPPGSEAMVVTFAGRPQILQEFTDNQSLLTKRIEEIEPTAGTTELLDALQIVDGLANPPQVKSQFDDREFQVVEEKRTEAFIISDGRFPAVEQFRLGNIYPRFLPVGTPDAVNVAVTAFSTRPSEVDPSQQQAFAELSNFVESDVAVSAELLMDGQLLDAKQVTLPAGSTAGVSFLLADVQPGSLRLDISAEELEDQLALDNNGHAVVNEARPGRVLLITEGNEALMPVLATERAARVANIEFQSPDYLESEEYKNAALTDVFDLIIYDRCQPNEVMPRANTLFLGIVPTLPPWNDSAAGAESNEAGDNNEPPARQTISPIIIDWNKLHPLMAYVELGDVLVAESFLTPDPPGSIPLFESSEGPIVSIAPRDHYEDVVVGFPLVMITEEGDRVFNTDWPHRPSFPTYWLNVLEYFATRASDVGQRHFQPGEPVEFTLAKSPERVTVIAPDANTYDVRRDHAGMYQFQNTEELGIYEVRSGDQTVLRFAVNLFDRRESDIGVQLVSNGDESEDGTSPAPLQIGVETIAAETGVQPVRRETWRWLLLAALVVLIVEWYIYNRRVYL